MARLIPNDLECKDSTEDNLPNNDGDDGKIALQQDLFHMILNLMILWQITYQPMIQTMEKLLQELIRLTKILH